MERKVDKGTYFNAVAFRNEINSYSTIQSTQELHFNVCCAISEKHLREFTGGNGLFWPKEPRDREPVWGAVCGCRGRPVMEGEPAHKTFYTREATVRDIISKYCKQQKKKKKRVNWRLVSCNALFYNYQILFVSSSGNMSDYIDILVNLIKISKK